MDWLEKSLSGYDCRLVAWENSPVTTMASRLAETGRHYLASESLNDGQAAERLWSLVHDLATYDIHLVGTNHLSDRELYVLLCERYLREPIKLPVPGTGWRVEWDCQLGSNNNVPELVTDRDRFLP